MFSGAFLLKPEFNGFIRSTGFLSESKFLELKNFLNLNNIQDSSLEEKSVGQSEHRASAGGNANFLSSCARIKNRRAGGRIILT